MSEEQPAQTTQETTTTTTPVTPLPTTTLTSSVLGRSYVPYSTVGRVPYVPYRSSYVPTTIAGGLYRSTLNPLLGRSFVPRVSYVPTVPVVNPVVPVTTTTTDDAEPVEVKAEETTVEDNTESKVTVQQSINNV